MTSGRLTRLGWVGALALLASCTGTDGPTAASPLDTPAVPGLSASSDAAKAEHERLKQELKALKERFKAERELRHEEFVLARDSWKLFKKQMKADRKNGIFQAVELLRCEPKEYEGDAELIGPDGGSIRVGEHELRIPKGALDQEVLISMEAPISDNVVVNLEPHGLRFDKTVSLELSYKDCVQPPSWARLFVVYLDDTSDQVLEITTSQDKKGIKSVTGDLEHFSRYAVAW